MLNVQRHLVTFTHVIPIMVNLELLLWERRLLPIAYRSFAIVIKLQYYFTIGSAKAILMKPYIQLSLQVF